MITVTIHHNTAALKHVGVGASNSVSKCLIVPTVKTHKGIFHILLLIITFRISLSFAVGANGNQN